MTFRGKVVIVTGSSGGIGATMAIKFAKEGADVVITARNEGKLKKIADSITKVGKQPLIIKADLNETEELKEIVNKTILKYGRLDVLINNGCSVKLGSIMDGVDKLLEAYNVCMNTSVRSAVQLTAIAAPHLIKTKGNIINVSSVVSTMVGVARGFNPYSMAKAALDHWTRCAASELGPYGVRVNCINPGPVRTDFLENAGYTTDEFNWDGFAQATLLGRASESDEIADLAVFLASDKAKGVTGAYHLVDNGFILKR